MQVKQDEAQFQQKVRVRVCGLLIQDEKILLLKHKGIGKAGHLWSPPGGGVNFGENVKVALIREFNEEVNLSIQVEDYLFTNEYVDAKHHAIELFFYVSATDTEPRLGYDPELSTKDQIISGMQFFSLSELNQIDIMNKHNIFRHCDQITELLELKGFYFFNNI